MNKVQQAFNELDYEVQQLLLTEDWMQANGAPRKLLGFIHDQIEQKTKKCTLEYFILKHDDWRKY